MLDTSFEREDVSELLPSAYCSMCISTSEPSLHVIRIKNQSPKSPDHTPREYQEPSTLSKCCVEVEDLLSK